MRYNPLPPLKELKEFFDYNPDTGIFTNKEDAIKAREEAEIKYFGEFRGNV